MRFHYRGTVKRTVIDTVSISVEADNDMEARETVKDALVVFPQPLSDNDVKYCYVENREPNTVRLIDLERVIPTDD